MRAFPRRPRGKFLGSGKWMLTKAFTYNSKMAGKIVVPEGFVSDGASIPRLAWIFIGSPWSGKYAPGAIIHDYIYHTNMFSRKDCDDIFMESMKVLKVPSWKRIIIHRSLRMFGWTCWKPYKKEK